MPNTRLSDSDLNKYREWIRVAKKQQDDMKERFTRYLDYYKGKHPIRIEKPNDHVIVNMIMPMVDIKIAAIAATSPVWRFVPRQPEAEVSALMWGGVMPWVWQEAQIHPQTRASWKDREIFGYGVVKLGYLFETDKEMFYDLTPEQYEAAKAGNPRDGVVLPDTPVELLDLQGQYVARDPSAVILHDNVCIKRVSPIRFLPDPEVDFLNLHDGEYVIQQCVRSLAEVKASKYYKDTKDLSGDKVWDVGLREDTQKVIGSDERDKAPEFTQRVTLWEIHDRKKGLIVTFAESKRDPIRVQPAPYEFDGFPFEVVGGSEVPDDWLPMGSVQHAIPMQDEKNLLRSRAATRVRRLVDKYAIPEDLLADGGMEALRSDEEGAVVKLTKPLTGGEMLIGSRGFPNDLRAHEANVDRDFSVVTAQPDYMRATAATGVDTATEANILREMAGVRSQDDQSKWDDFNARIGRKVRVLVRQYYDTERMAQVSPEVAREVQEAMMMQMAEQMGPMMAQADPMAAQAMQQQVQQTVIMGRSSAWLKVTPEMLNSDVDVEVESGSSAARNRVLEQERMTKQFAPLVGNPYINQEELFKLYIGKATDFAREKDRLVFTNEMVMQAQMMQKEEEEARKNGGVKAPQGNEESVTRGEAQVRSGMEGTNGR